jgi:hypothetical protein
MNFFRELVTEGTGVSSKRFISLLGMIIFIGVVVVNCFGIVLPEIILYTLVAIILGNQGLTLINKKGGSEPPV